MHNLPNTSCTNFKAREAVSNRHPPFIHALIFMQLWNSDAEAPPLNLSIKSAHSLEVQAFECEAKN